MRLFLAVNPANQARDQLRTQLAAMRSGLAEWDACVRWVQPEDVHLTLRFLGETPPDQQARLIAVLGTELAFPPFRTEVDGAGVFMARGRVRTLWLSIGDGRSELINVYSEVSRRLRSAGWPDEDRPFAPHLTIGRVRDQHTRRTAGLAHALAALPIARIGWLVDRVVLFSSDLSGPRPVHTAVHELRLAGGA